MTEYDNTNRGAMWKNDDKRGKTDPDLKGNVNVNGVECWLAGWWNQKPEGRQPHLKISVTPKDSQRAPNPNPPTQDDDYSDPLPF